MLVNIAYIEHMGMVNSMGVATITERKLRSTKVRLFTVPCCSIIAVSSERWEKTYSQLTPIFLSFYNSCLCFIIVFSPHISHIYQFCSVIACSIVACSIIKCAIIPFYIILVSMYILPGSQKDT